MQDHRLLQETLLDLGITQWVVRGRLPANSAAPSGTTDVVPRGDADRLRRLIEPLQEPDAAGERQRQRLGPDRTTSASTRTPQSTAATTGTILPLIGFWVSGTLALVEGSVTREGTRLLKDILQAAASDWRAKVQRVVFDPTQLGAASDVQRAQVAFLRKRLEVAAAEQVVLFGSKETIERLRDGVAPALSQVNARLVIGAELSQLLADAELKRQLWRDLFQE